MACTHCSSPGHIAKACTFGMDPKERFLFCDKEGDKVKCFPRKFIVPLSRGAADFKVDELREGCDPLTALAAGSPRRNPEVMSCAEAVA